MAARIDKVVRVEELNTAGSVHFREDTLFKDELDSNVGDNFALPSPLTEDDSEGRLTLSNGGISSSHGDITQVNDADLEEEDLPSEADDQLMPLPDNWPKIPQIFQKRSWNFSTAVSPTINKATSHLELLQNILEEWCREIESDMQSRASRKSMSRGPSQASSAGTSKRQLRFTSASTTKSSPLKMGRQAAESADSRMSKGLSVEGIGASADRLVVSEREEEETDYDAPYLGADEVIEEVITLLAKLENDRQETLDKLKVERQRVGMLRGKIDGLANSRMVDLPAAVQNEHEACAMDITELNWHVNYSSRTEKRIRNKTEIADALNKKLKEDIEFVKMHIPLVREKLDLELDAMSRIKQAQGDTTDELDKTQDRCDKVNDKSVEAHTKAEQERTVIKRDLDTVKDDLTNISEELAEAKMTHNAYIHQCNDLRQQLVDNKQEFEVLEVKNENAKVAEAMQQQKVHDLESKIVEAEEVYKELDDDNRHMVQKIDERTAKYADAEQEFNRAIDKKEDRLKKVTRRNQELEMDIEDCEKKSNTFDKQHTADEKNVERMRKELERTEEQLAICKEDLANVTLSNIAIKEQLSSQEEKCLAVEEQLRATADALRKQIKDEIHTKTVMAARIQSDSSDLIKSQGDTRGKKDRPLAIPSYKGMQVSRASAKADEVAAAVRTVQEKVEKLRNAHAEKLKAIAELEGEIDQINEEQKQMEEATQAQIDEISPEHKNVKDLLLDEEKKLDHMEWKTDMMRKKMEDMHASSGMMNRAVTKTQGNIDNLQEEFDELTIQIQSTQSVMEDLKHSISTIDSRMEMLDKDQRDMMKDRNDVLRHHEKELEDNLKLNKELAAKYRRLQNQYLAMKNDMLNKYDGRVKLENAIKDTRQLQSLQKKMNAALQEYFKFRGLYNQNELTRMEKESRVNGTKVSKLQVQMDMALEKISDFLKNQLDGDTIRRMAMEKVAAEERGEIVQNAYDSRPTTAATTATAY